MLESPAHRKPSALRPPPSSFSDSGVQFKPDLDVHARELVREEAEHVRERHLRDGVRPLLVLAHATNEAAAVLRLFGSALQVLSSMLDNVPRAAGRKEALTSWWWDRYGTKRQVVRKCTRLDRRVRTHSPVHTAAMCLSEQFISRSLKRYAPPCASSASLSISPSLIPPCFFRPLIGCRVSRFTGPVART